MSFPAHSTYRKSGVQWLGAIPADWRVQKFRYTFRESVEKIETDVVGPMLSVSGYRGIEIKDYDDENRRRTDEDLIGHRIVRPGQLVVNTMWLNYAGLGVSSHEGHVSPAYRSYWFADEDAVPRFIHYLLRSQTYVQGYTQLLTGIRPNSLQMSRADLMDFPVLLPPKQEQAVIADFLDLETAKIDTLIEKQQRLIALLDEKRQAVISHAVTKGLVPHAPMKDSGVPWLGHVPAHWEIVQLRRLTREHRQGFYSPEGYVDDGVPLLRITDIRDDHRIDVSESPRVRKDDALTEFLLSEGDFVFARTGGAGSFALIGVLSEPVAYASYLIRFRFKDEVRPEFLSRYFEADAFGRGIESTIHGGVNQNIHAEDIKNQYAPLPPLDEQELIAAYLHERSTRYDALKREAARAIELLRERKSALISATVTGRIDVRGLVQQQAEAA